MSVVHLTFDMAVAAGFNPAVPVKSRIGRQVEFTVDERLVRGSSTRAFRPADDWMVEPNEVQVWQFGLVGGMVLRAEDGAS
jgi:hypothetical protein